MINEGLGAWPDRRRVKSAGTVAIRFGERSLDYPQLADRVTRVAGVLQSRGVTNGTRVAYLGENHPAFLETLFATAYLGGIFVPLNTRLAAPEIGFALVDSGSDVLVHSLELAELAAGASAGTTLSTRLVVDDDFERLIDEAEPANEVESVTLDDPAVILYTSGTTGRPKGAVLTHGNLTWNSINVLVDYDLVSTDVALLISPMFHAASLGMGALPILMKGATLVIEPGFDPGRVLEVIESARVTWISGVPTTYQMLAEHPDWDRRDLSSLSKLTCGGSPVPLRVLEAYERRGLAFTGGYGMTETAPGATSLSASRSRDKAGSAGLPHFFTRVRVVDDGGADAATGEVGEIQVSGPNVIPQYWNRPDASAESFTEDHWFRSGDLGSFDQEGFLTISDRLKDLIISGGENIYPAEVEQVILELAGVGAVAVIGVPDDKWGEVPRAIVVRRDGYPLDEAQIRLHLEGRIARYKIPKSVVFVTDIPRTASGKIRKPELRELYGAR